LFNPQVPIAGKFLKKLPAAVAVNTTIHLMPNEWAQVLFEEEEGNF
jgi:hypothetical protein